MWSRRTSVLLLLLLLSASSASGGDQEGCQFCHRLEIRRSSAPRTKGGDLRVWEAPGGLHDPLYCSDCHPDARVAPHPSTPGPATCIGECHAPSPGVRDTHRRASFGGGIEVHRVLSAPRSPCLLCHRATDRKHDTEPIEVRCGNCHREERNSVARGVHARFARQGSAGMCARCHRMHSDPKDAPTVACEGSGCHRIVTAGMRRLAAHENSGGGTAGRISRAGVFLFIVTLGWASGRFLSPAGRKDP